MPRERKEGKGLAFDSPSNSWERECFFLVNKMSLYSWSGLSCDLILCRAASELHCGRACGNVVCIFGNFKNSKKDVTEMCKASQAGHILGY